MEAIMCPTCGGKGKELTEEKYECEVCGNVFLVHNLSKEFRKTDEHISDVHQDLSKKLDENHQDLSRQADENHQEVTERLEKIENLASGASDLKYQYENAYHLIEIGEYERAQRVFDTLCEQHSMNYQSWYGKVLIATHNFADTQTWDVLLGSDFWDVVAKMRKCEDYPQDVEERLNEFFDFWATTATGNLEHVKEKIEDFGAEMSRLPMKAIKLARLILLAVAECVTFELTFASIMRSIDIINIPPSNDPSWEELRRHIANLVAVPVKGVLGIAFMYLIYKGIKYLYKAVTEEFWYEIEEMFARRNPDYHGALEQAGKWFGPGKRSQELLEMFGQEINKHILFAEKVEQQMGPKRAGEWFETGKRSQESPEMLEQEMESEFEEMESEFEEMESEFEKLEPVFEELESSLRK